MKIVCVYSENVEHLLRVARQQEAAVHGVHSKGHLVSDVIDICLGLAVGSITSLANCAPEILEEDEASTFNEIVDLGIEIGQRLKEGQQVFSAKYTDGDKRDLHFYFIAPSEEVLYKRMKRALDKRWE